MVGEAPFHEGTTLPLRNGFYSGLSIRLGLPLCLLIDGLT